MNQQLVKPIIMNAKTVAKSRLFEVESVELIFSNGTNRIFERFKSKDNRSVLIVPVKNDSLLLVREYAVGSECYELGFPKGLIDEGEDILDAANRELKEEIGFGAKKLTVIKQMITSPSYCTGEMYVVLAEDLYEEKLLGDEPEPLIVKSWPMDNLLGLLDIPDFRESRSISALFLIDHYLKGINNKPPSFE